MRELPSLATAAWLVARKDLAIEFRTRTAFFSAIVFALLGLTIFYFAWDATAVAAIDLAPGVLWVIFTFSGLLGLQRSFGVEQADRAMEAFPQATLHWFERSGHFPMWDQPDETVRVILDATSTSKSK